MWLDLARGTRIAARKLKNFIVDIEVEEADLARWYKPADVIRWRS